jgi:hypothetical protein
MGNNVKISRNVNVGVALDILIIEDNTHDRCQYTCSQYHLRIWILSIPSHPNSEGLLHLLKMHCCCGQLYSGEHGDGSLIFIL